MYEDDNGIMHPTQEVWRDINSSLIDGMPIPYGVTGFSIGDCMSDGITLLDGPPNFMSCEDECLIDIATPDHLSNTHPKTRRPSDGNRRVDTPEMKKALDLRGVL